MLTALLLFCVSLVSTFGVLFLLKRLFRKEDTPFDGSQDWIDRYERDRALTLLSSLTFVGLLLLVLLLVALHLDPKGTYVFYGMLLSGVGGAWCGAALVERDDPTYVIAKIIDHKRIHLSFWLIAGLVGGIYLPERLFAGYSHFFTSLFRRGPTEVFIGLAKLVPAIIISLLVLGCGLAIFTLLMGMAEEYLSKKKPKQAVGEVS